MATPSLAGVNAKALREALGWSQEALAERAGIPQSYVSRVETGDNRGSGHTMRVALARGFGLSVEDVDAFLDGKMSLREAKRRALVAEGGRTGTEG